MTIHEREGRAAAGQLVDDDDRLCFVTADAAPAALQVKIVSVRDLSCNNRKKKNTSSVFFVTYNCKKKGD